MRYYVDTSAATKLLIEEAESAALRVFLNSVEESGDLVASALVETELRRVAIREDLDQGEVSVVLARFDVVHLPRSVFREAGVLPIAGLRSLDALHLAMASRTASDAIVAYDARLLEAARALGFEGVSPAPPDPVSEPSAEGDTVT